MTFYLILCTFGMYRLSSCADLVRKQHAELSCCLQEEIVARILGLLQPCQLHWVERVNTRLRNIGRLPEVSASSILSNT